MDGRPAAAGRSGGPQLLAATAAGVATTSALLHLPPLVPPAPGWGAVVPLALTAACLGCAVHLWRRPSVAAWAGHVGVAALMLAHPLLAPAGHVHGAGAWAPGVLLLLAGLGVLLGLLRWALGTDVPVRCRPGQMPAAGGSSGRRVPQA
ncbi:hypothetical protein ACI79J_08290 [Geodermatophilus sp. SYSU D01062]